MNNEYRQSVALSSWTYDSRSQHYIPFGFRRPPKDLIQLPFFQESPASIFDVAPEEQTRFLSQQQQQQQLQQQHHQHKHRSVENARRQTGGTYAGGGVLQSQPQSQRRQTQKSDLKQGGHVHVSKREFANVQDRLFSDDEKCRGEVQQRVGAELWGGKWAGVHSCVNVWDWHREMGPIFRQGLSEMGIDVLLEERRDKTVVKPDLRIFFINEPSLQDQMSASLPCLQKMCDEYDLPPTYMEIAMMTTSGSCGHRTLYEKRVSKGAKSRPDEKDKYKKRKPVTYDVWYELRHSFTTAETHRQLVNLHYDVAEKSTTIFFIGSQIGDVQRRVHQIFTGIEDGLFELDEKSTMNFSDEEVEEWSTGEMQDVLEDPFSLITVFMNFTFNDLFTIQADFDVRVWDQTSESFSLTPSVQITKTHLTDVHHLASNSLRYSTQLSRLFQTSLLLRSHHATFVEKILRPNQSLTSNMNRASDVSMSAPSAPVDWIMPGGRSDRAWGCVGDRVNEELASLVEKSRDLKGWAGEREGIVGNDINLRYNMITQRDSKLMASIANDARRDSGSMKTIAILTMVFLPGTFVSAILGMQFTGMSDMGTKGWQLYLAVAFPLTVLTLGVWYIWQKKNDSEHSKYYEYDFEV